MGLSLGATLVTLFALLAAMAFAPADASAANTCTLTSTAPITLWADPTKWSGCGGTYPGQAGGDTAIVNLGGSYTLKVDSFVNPVTLQIGTNFSPGVQVASGGTLTLESSSTATTGDTFTVLAGGTMGTNTGANITNFFGNVDLNGGTFNSAGAIQFGGTSLFSFDGGSLTGAGTIATTSSAQFTGSTSAMSINGTTFNDFGSLSYSGSTNSLTMSGGATINVFSGASFNLQNDLGINGTSSETIHILSGGTMSKTAGATFSALAVNVKNDGTITTSAAPSGGSIGLSGTGTHSGSFTTGTSNNFIAFGGTNAFNSGTALSGGSFIELKGGTQTFNASVTANSGIKWMGGTIDGTGPLVIPNTASMIFDGSVSGMTLKGALQSAAAMSYAPVVATNLLTIDSTGFFVVTGSLSIAGDFDILTNALPYPGTLKYGPGGTVTKTAGTSGSTIYAQLDSGFPGGTLANSASGPLNIAADTNNPGGIAGPIAPAAGSLIRFTVGEVDTSGTFSGSGTVEVAGGTLNINTATSFGSGTPNLNIKSGTLGGTGTVSILGSSNWSGGTVTGSAPFNVSSTGVLAISGAVGAMTLDGRVLNDNSSVVYNSPTNNLTLKNSASILSSGTFTAIGSGTIDTDGSAVSFTNNGQFNKTNSGLFIVKPQFNNNGTGVSITGGVLALDGDGTSTTTFTMSAGTEVWFPVPFSKTYTWAAGTTFSGGKVTIDAGNVATSAAMTINNTNLEVKGGSFTTPSTFTVTSPATMKWKGGTLAGSGHTVISAGTTFDMTTELAARSMNGHIIDNAGNATLIASTQPPSLDNGSVFNNTGNLDIQGNGSFITNATGANTFNNSGSVKKSGGTASFAFQIPYNQTAGTTDANSGSGSSSIVFLGGGSMSGGVLKATTNGDTVSFNAGTFNVSGGAFNSGAPGKIALAGTATLNINAPIATTSFIQGGGSLQGSSDLTISSGGNYDWSGGTMGSGAGQLVVAASGTLSVTGTSSTPLVLNSHKISNSGTISYGPLSGGQLNQLTLQGTASIANQSGGIINTPDNSSFLQSGGATSIVNSGTFQTSGSSSVAPTITNNATGLIKANAGMLSLLAGTSNGTLDAVSPGAINFGGGATFTINGGTWGGSGGGFWVTGGTVTFSGNYSLSGLAFNSGQIDGGAILTLNGNNAWGGGTMAGGGATTNNGTLTMSNNSGSILDFRAFNNVGTTNYQNGGNSLQLKNSATFSNTGVFDIQGNVNLTCNPPALLQNLGSATFKKSSGTGTSIVTAPFNNDGAVAATTGTIQFTAAGTHNGSFTPASGATIEFDGGNTFNAPSTLTGAGNIGFAFGTSTITSGTVNPGIFTVSGANVTLNSNATVGTLNVHNAANLSGTGTLTINGSSPLSEWTGGTISGSGTLTVGVTSNLIIDGLTAAMTLNTRPLVNNGTVTYGASANGLTLSNGAVITNASGATLNLDATPSLAVSGVGNAISNNGTLQRNVVGTEGIFPPVTNTGAIKANAGQLAFNGGLSQSSGSMALLGGSIYSPTTISLAGGSLIGNGTVFAAVNNSGGIVAPGSPIAAGIITLNGPYSQGSGGSMNLKIGGIGPGGTYDVVDASAVSVNLAGNLNVSLFNGFTPSSGNTFDILRFASRTGDFITPYNTPTFPGGGTFQSAYVAGTPNVLKLTAVVTSSDLMIAQSAPPSALHNQNATWTLTITNGPTPVTNVSVTDTFSNASFFSATSVGTCTPSGSTVTCAIGPLAANQSVNVSLTLTASTLATISNSASVTATEFDPNTANNNVGPAFTTVVPSADLSITNTASANPVNGGAPLSFVLNVANAGPDASAGTITVSNTVPSGVTGATGSGGGWSCGAQSGSVVTCTRSASLAPSSSAPPLTIAMNASGSSPAVDTATVSAASSGDPNSGNNSASQSVTVNSTANVSIAKTGPAAIFAGQTIVYSVVVTNNGPSPASLVTVSDSTPAGLTFLSNSGGCTTAYPCALGSMPNGQIITITSTYAVSSGLAGATISNTATVSSSTPDPVPANNSATANTTVNGSADVTITKSGPPTSAPGATLTYTITVTNNGPSDALAVNVNDATPANTTFVSNSGACIGTFPCLIGTLTAGQSKTITSNYTVSPSFNGLSISNTATATSSTTDPVANNSATATTSFGGAADLELTKTGPAAAPNGSTVAYAVAVRNIGPGTATGVVVTDPTPAGLSYSGTSGGCTTGFPCAIGNIAAGQTVTILAFYTMTATSGSVINIAQVSATSFDANSANDTATFTTVVGTSTCPQPPSLVAPGNGSTTGSPVTFSWTAVQGATSYKLFASLGGASTQEIGSTSSTSLTLPLASGSVTWSVQAIGVAGCNQLNSSNGTFNVCALPDTPVIAVVGTNTSGQSYTVQWTTIPGITNYELQEASTAGFTNPTTFAVTGASRSFTKSAVAPTAFFYRVRAIGGCNQSAGAYSSPERVVIVPVPPVNTQDNSATVDINNKKIVIQNVFIPGQGTAIPYAASTDETWLTVSPASGILLPQGITLQVSADPADLPNGTFTATVILTFPASGKIGTLDTKPAVSVPVSVSVVTPVSPATLSTPPANSLIIPSVGHLDGINSQWRSDVRITNTASTKINYLLRFTPAGGDATQIKQTQISISPNDTTALDDIVKNWYGVGALGDAANGVLEVRPLNTSNKGTPNAEDVSVSLATVASSRTFNQSAGGTLGQYIPAIPFSNFIGKTANDVRSGILSMQQISQSASYRTNLGIVEASGNPASVLVSVFDTTGKNLLDLPIDLKGGEQQQLNSFLAAHNITLADGRIEVKVTSGEGKVIAYASVVDNKTTDPLLVTGTPLAQTPSRTYVLPGVADLNNTLASWRSDLRVFNAGTDPQYVTMTLYPQTGSPTSDPISRSVSINPGEIATLDNVLASRFGLTNIGGAMHIDTLSDSNLFVSGRTYNLIEGGGTYGQYIAAVTPADATGKGGRTLNVLQVEDSTRYRTNLGIAEVSGKAATVEISVSLPGSKIAPKLQIPMAANEYRQFRVLQQLGVGTAYNARISIRVIDGDGKITAYGSVIDMQTQDPTYVPAQ